MLNIIGRSVDGDESERSKTKPGPEMKLEFSSGAQGTARVQIFTSDDQADRGGIVFKFEVDDKGSAFIPYAKMTEKGVEVHFAGEAEAISLVNALRGVLAAFPLREYH